MNHILDIMEWTLLGLLVLSAFHMPKISIFMLPNIGLSVYLQEWFLSVPDPIPSNVVTIINIITILLIVKFGEKGFHKIFISLSLLGFIGLSALYQTKTLLEIIEPGFILLYGVILLTIIKGSGYGARRILCASFLGGHSRNTNIVPGNKSSP